MGENQGAKHLQCSNPSSRVTILMGPMMIFQWHPVMEPPCVFLRRVFFVRDPSPNVSPIHWVRTSITSSPPVGSGSYGQGCTWGWCSKWRSSLAKDLMGLLGLPDDGVAAFHAQKGWRKGRLRGHADVAQFRRPRARSMSFAVKELPAMILLSRDPKGFLLCMGKSTTGPQGLTIPTMC